MSTQCHAFAGMVPWFVWAGGKRFAMGVFNVYKSNCSELIATRAIPPGAQCALFQSIWQFFPQLCL